MHLLSTCIFFQTIRCSVSGFFCECRLICLAEARLDCVLSVACLRRQWTPAATQHTYICRFDFLFGAVFSKPSDTLLLQPARDVRVRPACTWLHVLYVKVYINRIIWNRFKQQHEHSLYCGANLCNRCFILKKKTLATCFFNCGRVLAERRISSGRSLLTAGRRCMTEIAFRASNTGCPFSTSFKRAGSYGFQRS